MTRQEQALAKRIGRVLRAYRADLQISQAELAKKAKIGQPHLCALEHGKSLPSLPVVRRLGKYLGFTPDEIFRNWA